MKNRPSNVTQYLGFTLYQHVDGVDIYQDGEWLETVENDFTAKRLVKEWWRNA